MTENHPTTIPAILEDDQGGTLRVYPWASGRVSLVARDRGHRVEFGPVERHVLLDAIREVAGETDEPAEDSTKSPTADDFAKAEFARHPDGGIAARVDPCDRFPWRIGRHPNQGWWAPDTKMAEEGWQIVAPAEDSISRAELDARLARRDEAHKRQVTRMQRHIETLQGHLALRRKQMNEMRDQMAAMTPAPTTPRELLAMLPGMCWEPEGDTIPAGAGHVIVWDNGDITASSDGYHFAAPAAIGGGRRLLLDPPAPVTPAWHNARIVRATLDDVTCEWAQETGTLWRSLDGHGYIATADVLTDVTVVVPGEVEA